MANKTSKETIQEYGQTFGIKAKEGWYGQEIQTKPSDPLIDPGTGKPYIIRAFEFAKNPEFKGKLTKQEIFNMHWRQIQALLWGDGLVPNENINPRIHFRGNKYKIFILCQPRLRTFVADKPKTLQQLLGKKPKR